MYFFETIVFASISSFLLTVQAFGPFHPAIRPTFRQDRGRSNGQLNYATKHPKHLPTPTKPPKKSFPEEQLSSIGDSLQDLNPISPSAWTTVTSAALNFATRFAPKSLQQPSDRAARVRIHRLPPNSIQLDIRDVPIIGKALSGTYVKTQREPNNPAVTISSPRDKLKAIETATDTGKLEFGLFGLLQSYVDLQLEPNRPGKAPVTLKSPLIPQWPFSKQPSHWNKVTNMGNGETYYFNEQTGETLLEEPRQIY